jgi:fucose permease
VATAAENRVVNSAGLVQGITLVTFPAASSILTRPSGYALSSSQYGNMFLPQVVTAITASLLGSRLSQAWTPKRVLLVGLSANLMSMFLLLVSATVKSDQTVAYPLLLLATAFLGTGFGLTVPTVNTFVAAFHPQSVDRAVLVLNALLGLGTALAPVFVALFDGLGFWWGMPLLSVLLLVVLLLACVRQPLEDSSVADLPRQASPDSRRAGIPARFWLFAAFAVLYGICETMNGNWSQLYMTGRVGASSTEASLALTAFWAMVTVGRVLFAALGRWVPSRVAYHVLPFVLVGTFLLAAALPHGDVWSGIAIFALAGLGCSALLPLTISLGQEALTTMSSAVAGGVIAFYQSGYGIAAFGVGPLLNAGHSLSGIYGLTAVAAAAMGLLSFAVAHRRPSPRSVHAAPILPARAPLRPL